mgnify:CR=1 FL=1
MRTISVIALKGGVGKTTISVGLARAFQGMGMRVGLLDLDYRSPTSLVLLNMENMKVGRGDGDSLIPPTLDGLSVFSMGFVWPPEKAVMIEDELAMHDVEQILTPGIIAWPPLDILIIDSPPSSSGVVLALLKAPSLTSVIIVSQPSSLSRAALLRTMDLLAETQVPVYGIISNQGVDERGQNRFDLQDQDIIGLAALHNIPWCFCIPHTRTLAPHFDGLAQCILSTEPVLLPKPKEPKGVAWDRIIAVAQKLTEPKPSG